MDMTHLGSGICSQSWRMTGAIFCETRPAMIIKSDWRGDGRNTSAPKRAMSKRDAPMAIISMAQQARPKVMDQMEFLRAQLMALSRVVRMSPSGWPPSPNATLWMRVAVASAPTRFSNLSVPSLMLLLYSRDERQSSKTLPSLRDSNSPPTLTRHSRGGLPYSAPAGLSLSSLQLSIGHREKQVPPLRPRSASE